RGGGAPPRPPTRGVFVSPGSAACASPAPSGAGGRKRSALVLTRSASGRVAVAIVTLAVIPGLRRRSALSTLTITSYVTTFCTVTGAFRTCSTRPTKLDDG